MPPLRFTPLVLTATGGELIAPPSDPRHEPVFSQSKKIKATKPVWDWMHAEAKAQRMACRCDICMEWLKRNNYRAKPSGKLHHD